MAPKETLLKNEVNIEPEKLSDRQIAQKTETGNTETGKVPQSKTDPRANGTKSAPTGSKTRDAVITGLDMSGTQTGPTLRTLTPQAQFAQVKGSGPLLETGKAGQWNFFKQYCKNPNYAKQIGKFDPLNDLSVDTFERYHYQLVELAKTNDYAAETLACLAESQPQKFAADLIQLADQNPEAYFALNHIITKRPELFEPRKHGIESLTSDLLFDSPAHPLQKGSGRARLALEVANSHLEYFTGQQMGRLLGALGDTDAYQLVNNLGKSRPALLGSEPVMDWMTGRYIQKPDPTLGRLLGDAVRTASAETYINVAKKQLPFLNDFSPKTLREVLFAYDEGGIRQRSDILANNLQAIQDFEAYEPGSVAKLAGGDQHIRRFDRYSPEQLLGPASGQKPYFVFTAVADQGPGLEAFANSGAAHAHLGSDFDVRHYESGSVPELARQFISAMRNRNPSGGPVVIEIDLHGFGDGGVLSHATNNGTLYIRHLMESGDFSRYIPDGSVIIFNSCHAGEPGKIATQFGSNYGKHFIVYAYEGENAASAIYRGAADGQMTFDFRMRFGGEMLDVSAPGAGKAPVSLPDETLYKGTSPASSQGPVYMQKSDVSNFLRQEGTDKKNTDARNRTRTPAEFGITPNDFLAVSERLGQIGVTFEQTARDPATGYATLALFDTDSSMRIGEITSARLKEFTNQLDFYKSRFPNMKVLGTDRVVSSTASLEESYTSWHQKPGNAASDLADYLTYLNSFAQGLPHEIEASLPAVEAVLKEFGCELDYNGEFTHMVGENTVFSVQVSGGMGRRVLVKLADMAEDELAIAVLMKMGRHLYKVRASPGASAIEIVPGLAHINMMRQDAFAGMKEKVMKKGGTERQTYLCSLVSWMADMQFFNFGDSHGGNWIDWNWMAERIDFESFAQKSPHTFESLCKTLGLDFDPVEEAELMPVLKQTFVNRWGEIQTSYSQQRGEILGLYQQYMTSATPGEPPRLSGDFYKARTPEMIVRRFDDMNEYTPQRTWDLAMPNKGTGN